MATPQITVGQVRVQALLDVPLVLPPATMFSQVPAESWQEYRELYPHAFTGDGMIVSNAVCYVVRSPERTILVDMGLGAGPHQNMGGARGQLLEQLAAAGVAPDEIDAVVLTHLHGDHIGWAMGSQPGVAAPTFPRAKIFVSETDWRFFTEAGNPQGAALQNTVLPLYERGLVELVNGEYAVTPEFTMLPTPGHTPGHCSMFVHSQGEGCILTGDTLHSPAQITETDWSPVFDNNADASTESRWKVVQRADMENLILAANHFPFPGFGKIARFSGRRGFQVLDFPE